MDQESIQGAVRRQQVEESLKQECEQALVERVNRYIEISHARIIPNHYFAPPSAECLLSFRDGHFYGCIATVQAVTEALVRFLCEKNFWKPAKEFEKNIKDLNKRGFISERLKDLFLRIWQSRDDYHHLNSTILAQRQELEKLAKEKIGFLAEIEKDIFAFTITDQGAVVPKNPKYWDGADGQVFLRLE